MLKNDTTDTEALAALVAAIKYTGNNNSAKIETTAAAVSNSLWKKNR